MCSHVGTEPELLPPLEVWGEDMLFLENYHFLVDYLLLFYKKVPHNPDRSCTRLMQARKSVPLISAFSLCGAHSSQASFSSDITAN